MKKLQITAWVLFIIGLIFRLLHYPGTGIISFLGTLLLLVHAIIYLVKNATTNLPTSFLHLSYSLITTYILFRFQYWSCGPMIMGYSSLFLIALIVAITYFVLHLKNKIQFKLPQIFLFLYFTFFYILSFTHSHSIYYFFHLNPVLYGEHRKTNYHIWDRYSWFLYIANKKEEALKANDEAEKALFEEAKEFPEVMRDLDMIKEHRALMENNNLTTYP